MTGCTGVSAMRGSVFTPLLFCLNGVIFTSWYDNVVSWYDISCLNVHCLYLWEILNCKMREALIVLNVSFFLNQILINHLRMVHHQATSAIV